ncbi:MAG: TadE/TadG family type IV pilus assembly protein [Acidobacteriaceae bacterium]
MFPSTEPSRRFPLIPGIWLRPSYLRKRALAAKLRREEGATMVEFAISVGIFFAVTVGLLILCLALFTYEYVDFASQEAVRWAAVRGSKCLSTPTSSTMPDCPVTGSSDIQTYVQGLSYPVVTPGKISVRATWLQSNHTNPETWTTCGSTVCNAPGNEVQVTVSYPFNFGIDIPFVGSFTPNIASTSTMVISN